MKEDTRQMRCKKCSQTGIGMSWLRTHYRDVHGHKYNSARKSKEPALERIQAIEKSIKEAVDELEHERDQIHKRLLELDDLIGRYRALSIRNSK